MLTPESIWVNGTRVQAEVTGADQIPAGATQVYGHRDTDDDARHLSEAEMGAEVAVGYVWHVPSTPERDPWDDQWAAWSPVIGPVLTQIGGTHPGEEFAAQAVRQAFKTRYLPRRRIDALSVLVDRGEWSGREKEHTRWISTMSRGTGLVVTDPKRDTYGLGARYLPTEFAVRLVHAYRSATTA